MMAILCCNVERCSPTRASSIDIGMSIKKELDTLTMAILCCNVERCSLKITASTIDVGMSIKKERDTLMMAVLCCSVES